MNKRLMDAYDRMTMPDACARRIEGQLECQLRERKKGRYTRIQPPEPKTNWWAVGAALVCLVLAVSVGGTCLMLNLANDLPEQSTSATQPPVPETTAEETTGGAQPMSEFSDEGVCFWYPSNWQIEERRGEDGGTVFFSDPKLQTAPVFWMTRCEAGLVDVNQNLSQYRSQLESVYSDVENLKMTEMTIGGQNASKVFFTYTDGETGQRMAMTEYKTTANAVGYQFYCSRPIQQEQTYGEAVRELIASVQFGVDAQDYQFTENPDGTLTLTKYLGTKETVTIPNKIGDQQVTALGSADQLTGVFQNSAAVKTVYIPDGIESIGAKAFYYCESLETITLPPSIRKIGDYAFMGCKNLKSVNFLGDAPEMGANVFYAAEDAVVYYPVTAEGWSNPWWQRPTVAYEELGDFPLSRKGLNFLVKLCAVTPDWHGEAELDNGFWNEFLFSSFTSPDWIAGEEALLFGRNGRDMYRVSRETVENYARLALGKEIPLDFLPDRERVDYENGYFYIAAGSRTEEDYSLQSLTAHEDGWEIVLTFDRRSDLRGVVKKTVNFSLLPVENANGFVVTAKDTWYVAGP